MSTPRSRDSYGQLAVRLGYIDQAQLDECLHIQSKVWELGLKDSLGEILTKKGYLTPQQHLEILRHLGLRSDPFPGYTLQGKIGEGGAGTVYKAVQNSVNRTVAIKVLRNPPVHDKSYLPRFFHEARAAARLTHRNLIAAIDVGQAGGLYYFVMEYVDGKSCVDILETEGLFTQKRAIDIAVQMSEVLQYIHENDFVHRDIKPENILVTPGGTVKLCDLGLAKSTASVEQALTQTGITVGTPFFMSPEQCRGEKGVDIRSDLYSLGVSLYYITTGCYPFPGMSAAETMSMHLNDPVPDPRRLAPEMSEDLGQLIRKLLAKGPGNRYQTPASLGEDLKRIQEGAPPPEARLHAAREALKEKTHSTRRIVLVKSATPWWAVGLSVTALAAVVVLLIVLARGWNAPAVPVDDPAQVQEAARLYASSALLMDQRKWEKARTALHRLRDDFGSLEYARVRMASIGERIGVCEERAAENAAADLRAFREAQDALQAGRWEDARSLLSDLILGGRKDLQPRLARATLEIEATAGLGDIRTARARETWKSIPESIDRFRADFAGTDTFARCAAELDRIRLESVREVEAARLLQDARVHATSSRWKELTEALAAMEKLHETRTYKKHREDLGSLRRALAAANVRTAEDAAQRAWVAATQAYDAQMADRKFDQAIEALQKFSRDYATTAVFRSQQKDINARVASATDLRNLRREVESKALWDTAQKDMKSQEHQAAIKTIYRLLKDYSGTVLVRGQIVAIEKARSSCEETLGARGAVPSSLESPASYQDGVLPVPYYRGAADAVLHEAQPNRNDGVAPLCAADGDGPKGSGKDCNAILSWRVSGIPKGSIATAARVTLYVTNASSAAYGVFAVRRPWEENGVTWEAASTGKLWDAGGASGKADRGSAPVGTIGSGALGAISIPLNEAGVALVQSWIDDPTRNYGILVAAGRSSEGVDFASREWPTPSQRPKLTIEFRKP